MKIAKVILEFIFLNSFTRIVLHRNARFIRDLFVEVCLFCFFFAKISRKIYTEKMFLVFALIFAFLSIICCCLWFEFRWRCNKKKYPKCNDLLNNNKKHLCTKSFQSVLTIFRLQLMVNKSGHSIHLERHIIF